MYWGSLWCRLGWLCVVVGGGSKYYRGGQNTMIVYWPPPVKITYSILTGGHFATGSKYYTTPAVRRSAFLFLPPSWRHTHAHFAFAHRRQPLRWLIAMSQTLICKALRIGSVSHAQMYSHRNKTRSFCLKYTFLSTSSEILRQKGVIC